MSYSRNIDGFISPSPMRCCAKRAANRIASFMLTIRLAFAGDVVRGAVIHRRPNKRRAQRQSHAAKEMMQLKRNQTLVVIHAHDSVVIAARRMVKQAIGGKRTEGGNAFSFALLSTQVTIIFISSSPKIPSSPPWGIERRHRDAGMMDGEKIFGLWWVSVHSRSNIFPR